MSNARRWRRFLPLAIFTIGVTAAYVFGRNTPDPVPATAAELAAILRERGLVIEREETIDPSRWTYAQIDEGLSLAGAHLDIQILRIEDRDTFDAAEKAHAQFAMLQGGIVWEETNFTTVVTRRPYVVVIREEPSPGQLAAILEEVLPESVG